MNTLQAELNTGLTVTLANIAVNNGRTHDLKDELKHHLSKRGKRTKLKTLWTIYGLWQGRTEWASKYGITEDKLNQLLTDYMTSTLTA